MTHRANLGTYWAQTPVDSRDTPVTAGQTKIAVGQ